MQTFTDRFTSTRGGAIALGVLAAVIAAILLAVYITHYRSSVKSDTAPVQVLVAKRLIPAGTTGAQIGRKQLYTLSSVSKSAVQAGALTDPSSLNGVVASVDIYPGSQISSNAFTATGSSDTGAVGGLTSQLKANQRAVAIQIDALSGNLANLQPGDHVDIYQELRGSSGTIVKLFRANVPVLQVNSSGDPNTGAITGQIVVSVPARDTADTLYASKHTVLSFALRPAKGATPTPSETASSQTMQTYSRTH